MYIQYLYNDTWFKTKIPQTPFRLVIQKEWHCTGMSPPPIWRPTSQANPWSSKKYVKKRPCVFHQNEAKQEQIVLFQPGQFDFHGLKKGHWYCGGNARKKKTKELHTIFFSQSYFVNIFYFSKYSQYILISAGQNSFLWLPVKSYWPIQ